MGSSMVLARSYSKMATYTSGSSKAAFLKGMESSTTVIKKTGSMAFSKEASSQTYLNIITKENRKDTIKLYRSCMKESLIGLIMR